MDANEMSADGLLKLAQEKIKFEHDDHKYELHERDVLIRNLQEQIRILRVEKEQFSDRYEFLECESKRLSVVSDVSIIFMMISFGISLSCLGMYVFYWP